tara:strand:- start:1928 stop:2251 length:324 start_codon:yes stop_codon:yes gene_type:complete
MDAGSLSFTLSSLMSILLGAGGAFGVWFRLKGTISIQAIEILALKSDMQDIKVDMKSDKVQIHKRMDSQKELIEKNRVNSDIGIRGIEGKMNEMELRIIKAIHEIKK